MKATKNIYTWISNIDNLTTKNHFEELARVAHSAGSYEFIFSEHKFELNYIDGVAAINVTHTNKLGNCLVSSVVLNMIETNLHTNNI